MKTIKKFKQIKKQDLKDTKGGVPGKGETVELPRKRCIHGTLIGEICSPCYWASDWN